MYGDTQSLLAGGDVVSDALGCQPVHVQEEKLLVDVDLAPALKVQPVENLPDLGGKMFEALSKKRSSHHLLGPCGARARISHNPNVLLGHLSCTISKVAGIGTS